MAYPEMLLVCWKRANRLGTLEAGSFGIFALVVSSRVAHAGVAQLKTSCTFPSVPRWPHWPRCQSN